MPRVIGIARTKFAKVLAGRQSVKVVMSACATLTESRPSRILAATLVQVNLCSTSAGGRRLQRKARGSDSLFTSTLIRGCDLCYSGFLWRQWFMAALGYLSIVFVMFSGARRLGLHQNKTYGNDPEYQAYVKNTPILIPFLHI